MKRTKINDSQSPAILACDPSFTAWGWVVLQRHTLIDAGCIKTAPVSGKLRIRKGDDRVRRTGEIVTELLRIIQLHEIRYIVSELPHGSQNASAAVMMGIVVGILEGISGTAKIPTEWYSEADAKKALTGRNSASKSEVIQRVEEAFVIEITGPKYKQEAIADALAIYHVAELQSPTLKFITK